MLKRLTLMALCAMVMAGCAGQGSVWAPKGFGFLYSHTREPLMRNAHSTSMSEGNGSSGSVMQLQVQALRVSWSDNAIGDIARDNGIQIVYYADLETLRIFTFWTRNTVHIYGKPFEHGSGSIVSSADEPCDCDGGP